MGDSLLVMAWIPCSVPARTRYSFEVRGGKPSAGHRVSSRLDWGEKRRSTSEVALVDEAASFVDYLRGSSGGSEERDERNTQRPKMAMMAIGKKSMVG